jgi:hypothetical protein
MHFTNTDWMLRLFDSLHLQSAALVAVEAERAQIKGDDDCGLALVSSKKVRYLFR